MYIIERAKNYTKRFFMFLENRKGIKDKVVFESFSGQSYSDNPRAISERFHEYLQKQKLFGYLQTLRRKEVLYLLMYELKNVVLKQ